MKTIRFVLLIVFVFGLVVLSAPSVTANAASGCSLSAKQGQVAVNYVEFFGKCLSESNVWKTFHFGDGASTDVFLGADGTFWTWHNYDPTRNYVASFNGVSVDVVFVQSENSGPGVQIGSCTLPTQVLKSMKNRSNFLANGNANIDAGKGEIFGMTREWIALTVDITANGKLIGQVKISDNAGSDHWQCQLVSVQ